jgi:uncharacterized protein YcbX
MKVSELWLYPVKSMVGHTVSSVDLTNLGIAGDRHWAIRDNERGGIRGAKKIGELMQFVAQPVADNTAHIAISFPSGEVVRSDDTDVDKKLSRALGRSVTLQSLPQNGELEHFRRGAPDSADGLQELRGIFGREENEPLPDFSVFPPEVVEFESPPGTHHDCWPLLVMTTSAMAALSHALPASVVDILRFRPSLVIDTGVDGGHIEFSWKGRVASVGSATIEFLDPCPRCIMITRKINEKIPEDRSILRHVVKDLDQAVGVYARVLSPVVVSVHDELIFQS